MNYKCMIVFKTEHPVTQEKAQEFWANGDKFSANATRGPQTYAFEGTVEAPEPTVAVDHLIGTADAILGDHNDLRVLSVEAAETKD